MSFRTQGEVFEDRFRIELFMKALSPDTAKSKAELEARAILRRRIPPMPGIMRIEIRNIDVKEVSKGLLLKTYHVIVEGVVIVSFEELLRGFR